MKRIGLAIGLLACVAQAATAQVGAKAAGDWVGSPREEYVRLLQLTGVMPLTSGMIRPTDAPVNWTAPDSAPWRAPWRERYGPRTRDGGAATGAMTQFDQVFESKYNSSFPWGTNDGAMWAGRGVSMALTTGVRARVGPVTLDVAPTYTWSENRAFVLAPLVTPAAKASPYADQFESRRIDRPQRFGDLKLAMLDPGQTSVTVSAWGARAGAATRNMWWGPGIDNALIMTNNAAGFPHAFLATQRPISVGIGKLEVMHVLGTLTGSRYWRQETDTFARQRWVNGASLVFEPKGAPGMYLGVTRLFYSAQRYNPISMREVLTLIQPLEKKSLADSADPGGNDKRDQMLTLNFRFVFPGAGFEVYGEWGKNDHNWDRRDATLQPDHARASQVGARKVFRAGEGILSVRFEATELGWTLTSTQRDTPTWYAHHIIQQGYTQSGQVIGAGIGPGAAQQTLAIDWFRPSGRIGLVGSRFGGNKDAFYRTKVPDLFRMPASALVGPRVTFFSGPVQLDATYQFHYEFNRYTGIRNDVRNHRAELRVQY